MHHSPRHFRGANVSCYQYIYAVRALCGFASDPSYEARMTVNLNTLVLAQADWFCPRYRYLEYHSGGKAIEPPQHTSVPWPYEPESEQAVPVFERQRRVREAEVKLALQMYEGLPDEDTRQAILDTAFPQHFDHCNDCQFFNRCHGEKTDRAV